jgi:hypothetical protein
VGSVWESCSFLIEIWSEKVRIITSHSHRVLSTMYGTLFYLP